MSAALGPQAALDTLKALLGQAAMPPQPVGAFAALLVGTADPAHPSAEVSAPGYTRQAFIFVTQFDVVGYVSGAMSWPLVAGTTVGGVSVLTTRYSTTVNPLAWFDLPVPLIAATDLTVAIGGAGIRLTGAPQS